MDAKIGARLASTVCSSEVIIIQSPGGDWDITCGGCSMAPVGETVSGNLGLNPEYASRTELGKRYVTADGQLELLCVKPGEGSLAVNGQKLSIKGAKPLPSSD